MLPIDHFLRAAQRFPDRIAVKDGDTKITYAELARQTNALAAALQDIDPAPQTRVGICGYNTFEHLLAWLATFAAGKTWIPLNPRNGKPELDRICEVTHPGIVVVDHMGRPDVNKGVDHPDFARFINLMAENENIWAKVTCPERLTATGAPYDDVVPYYQAIVNRFEDRVLWGTDWPHPNMKSHMPDDGALVDYIPRIARNSEQQYKLLVANPMQLYWAT